MSEKRKKLDNLLAMSMIDEDFSDLLSSSKPSRSILDVLILLKYIEMEKQRARQEILQAIKDAGSSEIKEKIAERMLRLMDKYEESIDSITALISAFMAGTLPSTSLQKMPKKVSVEVR